MVRAPGRFVTMDDPRPDAEEVDAPMGPPVDEEEEKQRLLVDAREHHVDEATALGLAERLAATEPLAQAYRDVDRRLATGYTVDEAKAILIDEDPNPRVVSEGGEG